MRHLALIIPFLLAPPALAEEHPAEAHIRAFLDIAAQPRITSDAIVAILRPLSPDENVLMVSDMKETTEPGNWDEMVSLMLPPAQANMPTGTEISTMIGCRSISGSSFITALDRFQRGETDVSGNVPADARLAAFILEMFDEEGMLKPVIPADADALFYCNGNLMTRGFDPLEYPQIREILAADFRSLAEEEVTDMTHKILFTGTIGARSGSGQVIVFQLLTKRDIEDFRPRMPITQFIDFSFLSFALVGGS